MRIIQASHHQGNPKFSGNGRQCVANSVCAVRKTYASDPEEWEQKTLDGILEEGDKLYARLSNPDRQYLTLEDIPLDFGMTSDPLNGTLATVTDEPFFQLEDAVLALTKFKTHVGCIFTMGNSTPCYSSALIKYNNKFFFFDPHSRNECGMLSADGKATLTTHGNIHSLCLFVRHLAASLKLPVSYEISSLTIHSNDSESDFSGFEPISDGEYSCQLYLAQNLFDNVSFSSVSSCSSIHLSESESDSISSLDESTLTHIVKNLDDSTVYLQSIDITTFSDLIPTPPNDQCCKDITGEVGLGNSSDDSNTNGKDYDEDDLPLISLKKRSKRTVSYDHHKGGQSDLLPSEEIVYQKETEVSTSADDNAEKILQNVDSGISQVSDTIDPPEEITINGDTEVRPKRGRGRKRTRNESSWKRNVAKRLRREGKSYVSNATGRVKLARTIKPGCGNSCRYKCKDKMSDKDRETIFHTFWKLGEPIKQWQYLSKYAIRKEKQSKRYNSLKPRKYSFSWTMPKPGFDVVKVCKTFFLNTLSISERMVSTAYKKQEETGVCLNDGRGKHSIRPNRISEDLKETVRNHIESFKCIESHYCRKDSSKSYLPAGLNLIKMYRLYKQKCTEDGLTPVSLKRYRFIFDREYNLGFHSPIKDQCDFCVSYKNSPEDVQMAKKQQYNMHLFNKNKARENKSIDKEAALHNDNLVVACFDLEEVLLTPKSFESCLYYKRRLSTFNFTIYDMGTKKGHCYIWNEAIAGRGACEMASCVFDFIKKKSAEGKKHFIFYSDNCCAQNKNKFHISMLWFCLQKFELASIEHKYLIKGHTQNEADSIHAAVEVASRNLSIYTTPQWAATVRSARSSNPYVVTEMSLSDFFDFKSVSSHLKNFTINTENDKVEWHSFKTIKLTSEAPNVFTYQSDYCGKIKCVDLCQRLRSKDIPSPSRIALEILREDGIPIQKDKYLDLIRLCTSDIIPKVHHPFYLLLPHQ